MDSAIILATSKRLRDGGPRLVLSLASVLVAGLLALAVGVSVANTRRLAEDHRRVVQTIEDLRRLQDVLSTMKDAETGQRGFVITGREEYLRPYHSALESIRGSVDAIGPGFTASGKGEQFTALKSEIGRKLDELSETIALRREGGFDAAARIVLTDRGKQAMDKIRAIITEAMASERLLLARHIDESEASLGRAFAAFLASTVAALVILMALVFLLLVFLGSRRRAEESLRQSEGKVRQLADSMPLIVWAARPDGHVDYYNERWYEYTGRPRQAEGDESWVPVLHPDDIEACLDAWHRAVETGRPFRAEHRFKGHASGEYRWHVARASPARDASGRVTRWFGTATDIHEERLQAEALREAEARQRRAMSAARLAHWEWDLRSDRILYQDSLARLFNCPDERPFADLADCLAVIPPEDHAVIIAAAERARMPGVPYEVEHRVTWPDGTIHWIASRGGVVFAEDGTPLRMVGVNQDITDRKASEAEILLLNEGLERRVRERTAELRQQVRLIDQAHDAILVRSEGDVISSWNQGAERTYGWSAGEAVGRVSHELLGTRFPGSLAEIEGEMARLGSWEGELDHRRKDGARIAVASRWVVDRDASSGGAILEINSDITERKASAEALRRARDEAMAANRAKSEFLANMSHEIRTPMNGVLGMTELALATDLTPRQREYLGLAKSSADALLVVIADILDFSKIEAGKLTLDPLPFRIRDAVTDTLRALAARAHEKGLELACRVAPGVPDSIIGDPGRLRQILLNLAGNAIKFTEHGEVVVSIEVDEGEGLRFAVADTGIGIPEAKRAAIFAPFEQADGSTTRKYGGTGLGLTISSRLVELMQGRIWVEENPGGGSVFRFNARLDPDPDSRPLPEAADPGRLAGLRALVVDDNRTNRFILEELLARWGCRPVSVPGGAEALAALAGAVEAGEPFELILLDRMMPGMDGIELAGRIRRDPDLGGVPMLMLTSGGDDESGRSGELGIGGWLSKPIGHSDLLDALLDVLGLGDPSGSVAAPGPVEAGAGPTRRLRVLLAEDHPINQKVARGMLEDQGHEVSVVDDGRAAVGASGQGEFDVILMDVQMPLMDGFEAVAAIRLRERGSGRHVPIVALTAHAMAGDRERCLGSGFDDYLSKPIQSATLRAALGRIDGPGAAHLVAAAGGVIVDLPSFDRASALENLGGDEGLLDEVIDMFLDECPRLLATIRGAIGTGDAVALGRAAHTVTGVAGNFAAAAIVEPARRLQVMADVGDLSGAAAAEAELGRALDRFRVAAGATGIGVA